MNACAEAAIRFFTAKYKILQLYQRNTKFRIVPKWPLVFYNEIQKLESFPTTKYKVLKLFRNFHLLFDNKLKNLKLHSNCHWFFEHDIQNLKLYANDLSLLNTNSDNRNLIIYFYNELLVIQKKPTKLLGNYLVVK